MVDVECMGCLLKLRRDIAYMDSKWIVMEFKKGSGIKHLCRECAKEIAKIVIEEF